MCWTALGAGPGEHGMLSTPPPDTTGLLRPVLGLHLKTDGERLDKDLRKANQRARIRSTWHDRPRGWACLAYSYLKHGYRDDGQSLQWCKRGNSLQLQVGRVRVEGSIAYKRSPEGDGGNPYTWAVFKAGRKPVLM